MKHRQLLLPLSLLLLFSITACGNNNDKSHLGPRSEQNASSNVNSDPAELTGIYLNYDTASIYVGKKFTLSVIYEPENAEHKNVTWSSSDASVASVSNGVVTANKIGSAVITATLEKGFTASCTVSVIEKEESATYVPDKNDPDILIIDDDNLSSGTYDSASGEYTFSINQNYKQIYVNVPDKVLTLELNGVTIENGANSPIYVADCDSIDISAKKSTTNYIKDTRVAYSEDDSAQGKGAIFVENGDLKLKGTGKLNIVANYYNGVHAKDDVKIQKQTLDIKAVHHGIKGNDSVTINSGDINISCGGDGLHTENTDVSDKGNQRGNVVVNGGNVTINSWGDAIAAAYNAEVHQADATISTSLNIATNKYSSYDGEVIDTSVSTFYLKMNSSTYSKGNYTYAAYIDGQWYAATYKGEQTASSGQTGPGGGPGGQRPGGSSTSYIYEINKPSGATSFTLYRFAGKDVTNFSLDSYNAKSDAKAFNGDYDTVTISVSSGKIGFSDWSNNADANSISAKGLKAENEINITAGEIVINTYDDGIHVNNEAVFEESVSVGAINISGGTLDIKAADDGIHSDYKVNISGGKTNVIQAYEGIEGNVINISGGETYVYATDDGMNATKGKDNPSINVSGGFLDVGVPGNGDTDGIDSNGSYTQTGGVVIVKGPGSASGNAFGAAALDTDGAVSLSNCTLAVFGGIEKTPSTSLTKTLCSSSNVSAGNHTITVGNNTYQTTLKSSTNGCVVYSNQGTATLK